MSESIGRRVGRLVSGGFNALLNAVENSAPDVIMQQAIREVDEAIDDVRAELGKVIASKHLASSRLMDENRKRAERIFAQGKEHAFLAMNSIDGDFEEVATKGDLVAVSDGN